MTKYHVTHTSPDLDALLSSWLLLKFEYGLNSWDGMTNHLKFVNTGNPDPAIVYDAHSISDTGKEYDPDDLAFDHHQFDGSAASETSATEQVFEYLLPFHNVDNLEFLLEIVTLGDAGKAPKESYEYGIHALLSAFKAEMIDCEGRRATDYEVAEFMFKEFGTLFALCESKSSELPKLLDYRDDLRYKAIIARHIERRKQIADELADIVQWKSEDGKVWALLNGSVAHSMVAYEQGAILTVFKDEVGIPLEDGRRTYPVGISRNSEATNANVGQLVDGIFQGYRLAGNSSWDVIVEEIGNRGDDGAWYRHNAGFFAGSGTPKAPVPRNNPPVFDLVELAKLVDREWER